MQNRFKHFIAGLIVLFGIGSGLSLKAQNATDFRLNEILVHNDSNYVDEYGEHSPWIEIANSSYSNVNIAGCYFTDDLNNPKKYWIPTGSPETLVHPRGYLVFFADGKPSRGIFHLNFILEEGKTIALFDANGRTLIDKLLVKTGQKPDISYARVSPDTDEWIFKEKTTPGSNNDHNRRASAGEKFGAMDPSGIGMTMIAMSVVFSALALLFLIYKTMGRFFTRTRKAKVKPGELTPAVTEGEISGEMNAAIAMALYLYQSEAHDFENTVLTIKKVSKTYSPWSSKIYTLRKTPR